MPFEHVRFTTGNCEPPPIDVDRPIVNLGADDVLRLHNGLDGNVPAEMRFYDIHDTQKTQPLEGFCTGMTPPNAAVLPLPGQGSPTDCQPAKGGLFAYTVTEASHAELDPVLIIEPAKDSVGSLTFGVLPMILIALATAVVGFFGGRMWRRN